MEVQASALPDGKAPRISTMRRVDDGSPVTGLYKVPMIAEEDDWHYLVMCQVLTYQLNFHFVKNVEFFGGKHHPICGGCIDLLP